MFVRVYVCKYTDQGQIYCERTTTRTPTCTHARTHASTPKHMCSLYSHPLSLAPPPSPPPLSCDLARSLVLLLAASLVALSLSCSV
jgi:hypothetical protein